MEVHAHTHTERKKWTHYFWEFLMLFLAVFCGFLAEYQLEHKIEKDRAIQYVQSFYADLKTDTAEFSILIDQYESKVKGLENRRECYDTLKRDIKSGECLMNLFSHSINFPDLINADQTLLQLKNAGGLRLLNQEDADSILQYDKMIRFYIRSETTGFQEYQYNIRTVIQSLMNYELLGQKNENRKVPVIFSENRELLNRFFNLLDAYFTRSEELLKFIKTLKQNAVRLIEYFKYKHHLK